MQTQFNMLNKYQIRSQSLGRSGIVFLHMYKFFALIHNSKQASKIQIIHNDLREIYCNFHKILERFAIRGGLWENNSAE